MNNVIECMLTRKSVRTYEDKKIPDELIEKIKTYLADTGSYASPFGSAVRFELFENGGIDTKNVIKHASVYAVAVIKNNNESLIDAGFIFERFVLFIETLGLSTCYLNSGFQRDSVPLKIPLEKDEIMILATPIGFAAGKKSFADKGVQFFLGSRSRKPLDDLFYKNDSKAPVEERKIREGLEYVRWAPSAMNAQPWRIVFDGGKAHFYIAGKEAAKKRGGFNIHVLDIGIAVCHYALVFNKNSFYAEEPPRDLEDMRYLLTVV